MQSGEKSISGRLKILSIGDSVLFHAALTLEDFTGKFGKVTDFPFKVNKFRF